MGCWGEYLRLGERRGTGEWRKLHNEELNYLYWSSNNFQMINLRVKWAVHVACMGERWGVYRVFVGRPEGKRPLGWPIRGWEDIKMDLQKVGWGMDWIELAQDSDRCHALVNDVLMHLHWLWSLKTRSSQAECLFCPKTLCTWSSQLKWSAWILTLLAMKCASTPWTAALI